MKSSPVQIVLLGGGYVSVWAYRSLMKQLRSQITDGQIVITVVSPLPYHSFHGWTAESLTDIITEQNRRSPLTEIIPNAKLVLAEAESVDQATQQVHIRTNTGERQTLHYDHLLLGIGSFDNAAVEGIRTYGYQIKDPVAFQLARKTLHQLLQQAAQSDPDTARQLLSITVAGGGFAGIELVTNLAEWIDVMKKQYPTLRTVRPQIRLINRSNRVLTTLQPAFDRLISYTEKTMRQYKIEVHYNAELTKVTSEGAYLSNGTFLKSSMVFSTVGQSRVVLAGTEKLPRDRMQRLLTNSYQQINGLPTLWGGGDACNVTHHQTGLPCPASALWAIKHGEYAGRNIARAIKGKPLKPFTYRGLGQAASLGLGKGISELYGFQFTGLLSWITRWLFFHYFMPSRRLMRNTLTDWFHLFFRGRRGGAGYEQTPMEYPTAYQRLRHLCFMLNGS